MRVRSDSLCSGAGNHGCTVVYIHVHTSVQPVPRFSRHYCHGRHTAATPPHRRRRHTAASPPTPTLLPSHSFYTMEPPPKPFLVLSNNHLCTSATATPTPTTTTHHVVDVVPLTAEAIAQVKGCFEIPRSAGCQDQRPWWWHTALRYPRGATKAW
jgi:hypothetical protein